MLCSFATQDLSLQKTNKGRCSSISICFCHGFTWTVPLKENNRWTCVCVRMCVCVCVQPAGARMGLPECRDQQWPALWRSRQTTVELQASLLLLQDMLWMLNQVLQHTHTHTHTHIHSVTSLIMTMLLLLCIFMDTGWHYMRPQHWLIHRCMHIWCINNIDEFSVDNSLQKCREIQKIQQLRDSVNHWVSDGSNAVVQTIVFVSHFCR